MGGDAGQVEYLIGTEQQVHMDPGVEAASAMQQGLDAALQVGQGPERAVEEFGAEGGVSRAETARAHLGVQGRSRPRSLAQDAKEGACGHLACRGGRWRRGGHGTVRVALLARSGSHGCARVRAMPRGTGRARGGRFVAPPIVGNSEPMKRLRALIARVAPTGATVLITGENGTGKELVARHVHALSPRAGEPFVAVNCSAFNDNLLESEMFGHRRGAFTGAVADKKGLFEAADGGTFFMDEVGEMSPALQAKLLRVLQDGTFLPVGDGRPRKVDVRVVAATNRNLRERVAEGHFREDLYYRLRVVELHVPPLRERRDDIPLLVEFFLGRLAERHGSRKRLAPETLARLKAGVWPGNVRELENDLERMWVLSGDEEVIGPEYVETEPRLEPAASSEAAAFRFEGMTLPQAVAELERRMIREALRHAEGRRTAAAKALGISPKVLARKMTSLGLEVG